MKAVKQIVSIAGLFALMMTAATVHAQRVVVRTTQKVIVKRPTCVVVPSKVVTVVNKPTVVTVTKVPTNSVLVRYKEIDYRYVDGVYYKPQNGVYVQTVAPVGLCVYTLPKHAVRVIVNDQVYYTYKGVYYRTTRNGNYVVVKSLV